MAKLDLTGKRFGNLTTFKKGIRNQSMKAIESIYAGYRTMYPGMETEETAAVFQEFMQLVDSVMDKSKYSTKTLEGLMQKVAELGFCYEKQGFITGYQYAANISLECQEGKETLWNR